MNDDGTMARVKDLIPYCERHGLKMVTVGDLIKYRRRTERLVERVAEAHLPTEYGDFNVVGYRSLLDNKHHVALVKGDVRAAAERGESVMVRVHSECLTGDVFHSLRCDCGQQLADALERIETEGLGVLLYLSQEGRGIGLLNKLGLQAPGGRPRHRRREPRAGPARRPARLRHRRPDPGRPRAEVDPHPDQQPEEDRRPRGIRPRRSPTRSRSSRRPASTTATTCAPSATSSATRCTTRDCRSTRTCSARSSAPTAHARWPSRGWSPGWSSRPTSSVS